MSDDYDLQHAVLAELTWEPSVTAAHIGVAARAGIITLSGHVENFAEKHAAETAAYRVKGVVAVADELAVKLPAETTRSDDDIAAAAVERLSWDVVVPRDSIRTTVERGWVTLTGQVGQYHQKQAAEQDIRRLFGVVGVSNQITIKSQVNAQNISDDIMHALRRSWFADPELITVSADGGRIRLSGIVHSARDRTLAAAAAWAAPGAVAVQNDIAVT